MDRPHMYWQPRRFGWAWVALATGLAWLVLGWRADIVVAVVATLPGAVLIAAGGAALLWAGDRQINYHMAFMAVVSGVLALVLAPALGVLAAIVLIAGAIGTYFVAGWASLVQQPVPVGLSRPRPSLSLVRKVAADDALLGFFVNCARIPRGPAADSDAREITALAGIARRRGWDKQPTRLHAAPGPPRTWRIRSVRAARQNYEWLSFASGFRIDPGLPGATRWDGYARNRRMGARVLRHAGRRRPWLVCIHGYRMGVAAMDLPLFDVARLHRQLDCNIIMPILPLHGPRRATWLTGGLFLDGPLADLLHAQTQALWDLRRCLAWIRRDDPAARIGVIGFSLGGYNAALLAAFDADLACVIAGIPLTDIPASLWRHMPGAHRAYLEAYGITPARLADLMAPVSPLHLPAKVAFARRFIFAAAADQMVGAEQALRLWRHWGRPPIHWYDGSHLSVRREPGVGPFIEQALRTSAIIG